MTPSRWARAVVCVTRAGGESADAESLTSTNDLAIASRNKVESRQSRSKAAAVGSSGGAANSSRMSFCRPRAADWAAPRSWSHAEAAPGWAAAMGAGGRLACRTIAIDEPTTQGIPMKQENWANIDHFNFIGEPHDARQEIGD